LQAGPGTIAEAMIRGLPIILNDYIAGQVFSLASIVGSGWYRFLFMVLICIVVTMCRFGIWLSVNIGHHNNIESPGSSTHFCAFFLRIHFYVKYLVKWLVKVT